MEQSDKPNWKLDQARVKDLAEFFRIDRTAVPDAMKAMGIPKRGAGYPWIRIWVALGIDLETVKDPEDLKKPLAELKQVAALLGESPRTVRRRSEGEHRDKSIPAYIELGPRKRLFFPAEIESWLLGEQLPFGREQKNLSFIPGQAKKTGAAKEARREAEAALSPSPSAAALFMVPPEPG
ncbi:helix-turn-helix transcriptional regulator [Leisingera aquimarina]|uniref:helix-turn-helix transcriptional regulator n=1 Tax=Leisingera aquimarina TaxID=476529 RepID=UPI0004221CCD|nr:hypothetical protein [Leisingera aquimarina]